MKISQVDLTSSYQTVNIMDYRLNGMCQYNGKLDYFVGLHTSGDLRVCSVTTDTSGIIIPQYCKSIPKTIPIESKYIMTDCKWKGTVNSMNQYIIAVGASSLDPLKPGQYNYLYAKFDTSLNITETIIQSNDPDVSERLVDVKVDLVHEQVYVILDINTNMYQGVSIFGPGDNFTENNPNIALIAYSFDNAAIQWIKILGDKSYIDYYSDLEVVDNHVIVMTNSYTTQFSSPMPSKDIILWKFRYDTGIQDYKLIMGSPTDDTSFDLISFYHGLYILATFNNNFYPHPNLGSVWGTYSNSTAFGMIWLSHDLSIVDIEGYPYSSLSTIPMRVFPSLFNEFKPQFLFISPASTVQSNGALFTQFTAPNSLFSSVDCNLTCATCDRYTKSNNCISCNIGEILYQGDCVSSCPIRSFQVVNKLTSATISHCIGCDYSCMNCLGQKKNQCTLCCSSGSCGSSLLDMNPNFGTCTCPSGTYESSGVCLDKCVNGLHGRIASKCYEFCPKNTFPIIKYDDPTNANEITHYEEANLTLCQDFNNVLKFNVTGQGIEVPGPPGLSSMLPEFTLSFWFRAELFNSETYLINLFQRVFIKVVSNKVHFIFERSSGDLIEPTYSGILNQISTNTWVYVSVSQIERKVSGNYYITQKIVIANGRSTDAVEAGSSSISAPVNYHKFVNTILIGGYNSTDFKSFTGYIKEIRLFNQFHDSPQMIVDKLRFYQIYSYDDNHLISYWRLSENFTSSDTVYKINDYSFSNMNNALNVMFSPVTNPNFPTFLYSYSLGLKLCYYHDVASCRTLANVPKIFSKGWRVTNPSNFKLTSLSHTIKYGDIINFKLGDCNTGTIKAIITNGLNSVWNPDSTYPPELLLDGVHYSMCYSAVIDGYNIDLGQMYLIKTSTKVDPSDFSSMVIIGLQIQVDVSGGDEAYGDIIRFSVDCDAPQTTDYYIERKTGLIFGMLITKNFQQSKVFKMCYLHSFAFGLDLYMDNINNHVWTASQTPTLDTTTPFSFYINDYPLSFKFSSAFTEGDTILFAWKQSSGNDCDSANFLSSSFLFKYGYLQLIWLGNDQGIHGITQQSSQVHMCWRSNAYGGDPSYLRVGLSTGQSYEFSTLGYTLASRINLPEINFIKPHYGSTEFYGTDGVLQIDFGGDNVFPAKRSGIKGSLAVYRGAVKYDGSIVMITTNPLYLITTLDEAAGTPLQQGNINCTTSGLCNVTLSAATSTGMSYGEIYFLALFPNSFSNNVASNYYLFANNTNSGSSIYNHLFMCRSFNIIASPTAKIFGTNLVIQGENLLKIDNVLAKESLGTIVTSTFTTIHIKISLSIQSTTCSTSLLPFASIYMTNVNDTYINIYNMDLKGCNNGNIYGSFELTRGIKLGLNSYGYIKTEYLDGVALGSIGCDSTCKDCTGPTANDCTICTNFATSYLYQGKCYSVCPTVAPYWMLNYKVFQSAQYAVLQCVSSCPIQYFTNTDTNECEQCNSDCQTCASNKMASCITCNPIKYFYYGVCVEFCPSPLYTVDNTNYQCLKKNITSNLSVSIIKPPYLYKIPRNKQLYLKAYIDNSRGNISSVRWDQVAPTYTRVSDNVYTMSINNITNEPYNTQLLLKFKMTSFTYISEITSIKILLEVNNSYGDSAQQLSEFYINPAPNIGNIQQEILCGVTKPIDGTCNIRIRLSGWYDNVNDLSQQLKFKLYYQYNSQTYILKDAGSSEIFDFTIPYISMSDAGKRVTISLCISAIDKYLAASDQCISFKNILVTYSATTLVTFAQTAAVADMSNTDTLLYTVASMEILIPTLVKSSISSTICDTDTDCFSGICDSQSGVNYCKCNQGFQGVNCQYSNGAFKTLQKAANNIFNQLWSKYGSVTTIEVFDFDIIISSIKGLLKDPQLLSRTVLDKILSLFQKCSLMENYKVVALQDYSITNYLKAAERIFGKIYFEKKMIKFDIGAIRYNGANNQESNTLSMTETGLLAIFAKQTQDSILAFIKQIMLQLDTTNNEYLYVGEFAFEFKLSAGYPPDFEGKTYYIKNSDYFWEIPIGLFSSFQNVASYVQQVYVMAIKWVANPILFNGISQTQIGVNITTFTVFDGIGNELHVQNLTTPINAIIPYVETTGYPKEFLRCQFFDDKAKLFKSDGCGQSFLDSITLPCSNCATDNSYVITEVFKCSCNHLSTIGGVYQPNSISKRDYPKTGICLNYFAMNYWKQSFGYYLVWPSLCVYIVGMIIAITIDCFTLGKMRKRILERILLVGELNEIEQARQDKIKERENEEKRMKGERVNSHESKDKKGKMIEEEKKIDKEYHSDNENGHDQQLIVKTKKKLVKKKVLKKKEKSENNFIENKKFGTDMIKDKDESQNSVSTKPADEMRHIEIDPETGLVQITKKNGKKPLKKKKKINGTDDIKNGDEVEEKNGDISKMKNGDKNKDKEEVKLSEGSDSRSDEERDLVIHKVPTTVDIFENERGICSMLIYSNAFTNTIFINSYLCPRHIRASMLFTNLTIIWFLAAVLYNNTKDPLVVPDFQTKARNLAQNDVWMAFIVPIVSSISGYVFWSIFRVNDQRFHQPDSYKKVKDGSMVKGLLKEMYLRFIMAYFVMVAVYCAVMWYIVKFTAKFGWKVSWTWWYTGTFAFFFNYFLYDPIITWFHYVTYGCSKIMWRKVMRCRGIKIACSEVNDNLHIPVECEERDKYLLNKKNYKDPEPEIEEDMKIQDLNEDKLTVFEYDNQNEIQMVDLKSKG